MSEDGSEKSHNGPKASGDSGLYDVVIASNCSSPTALSLSSNDTNPRSFGEPILPVEGHIDTGMLTGAEVVDLTHEGLEWQGNNKCWSRPDYQQRRVQARLGCGLRGTEDSGSMDSRGKESSHKCFGTEGRSFCPAHICPESEKCSHTSENGQSDCSSLYPEIGGTRSAQMLPTTQEIWQFCLDREIFLSAEYLPGSLNTEADWQSRNFRDSSDWRLRVSVFKSLDKVLGPFTIDLFASRHNAQLPKYVSWKQDPFSVGVDAFQRSWRVDGLYLFPPFAMIPRCLQKIQQEQATVTLIAPPWQSQPWFPKLLSLLVRRPILLPPYKDLLTSPTQSCHPLSDQAKFRLAAWKLSGDTTTTLEFLKMLPNYSQSIPGGEGQLGLITAAGDSGLAGVVANKLIHFDPLW